MTRRAQPLRVAFVGSWVPRRCGIATFTADLVGAIRTGDVAPTCAVIAIDEPGASRTYDDSVIGRIVQHDRSSYRAAAQVAAGWGADVLNIQHEFGLYGTDDGRAYTDHLVALLDALRIPAVTTLHTVLPHPDPWMRDVVRTIARRSAATVVMTAMAAQLLRDDYGIERPAVVIPHGVPTQEPGADQRDAAKRRLGYEGRRVISTFGLVDPRKGIEYAIEAVAQIVEERPDILYLVAGQTHPDLIRRDGEAYREHLVAQAAALGLGDHVVFQNEYLSIGRIMDLLGATDAYVTPYLDPNQITSGTLAYALGAGRAVISTRYLHAAEVLADGRGILVDFRSASEIATALTSILDTPVFQARLEQRAHEYGRHAAWPAVGNRFVRLMSEVAAAARPRLTPTLPARTATVSRSAA